MPPDSSTPEPARTQDSHAPGRTTVPPLPPVRGAGLAHFVIVCMVAWLVALIIAVIMIPTLQDHDAMVWLWTALAGFCLGFVGLAIYGWQRAAARRGSRGASSMALEEESITRRR